MKVRFDVSGGGLAEEATRRLLTHKRAPPTPTRQLLGALLVLLVAAVARWVQSCRCWSPPPCTSPLWPSLHCRLTTICVGHFAGPRLPPMPWLTPSMLRTLPLLPLLWP